MSRARLFLSGIRAEGRHGARAGEKDEPQPFVVDLDLEVEVHDDSIEATADYRGDHGRGPRGHRTAVVRPHRVDGRRDRAPDRVVPQVATATAVVHKPNAAGRLGIDGVAAAATATGDPTAGG